MPQNNNEIDWKQIERIKATQAHTDWILKGGDGRTTTDFFNDYWVEVIASHEQKVRVIEKKRAIIVMSEFIKKKGNENYPLGQYLNMLLEMDKLQGNEKN